MPPDPIPTAPPDLTRLLALGDWERVARLYEVELEVAPPERRAQLCGALGRTLAERVGDLVGAAVRLEEAVRLAPGDESLKEALASLYILPDFPHTPDGTEQ